MHRLAWALSLVALAGTARAETLLAPVGGKPLRLEGRVACDATLAHGWTVEADRRALRPPSSATEIGAAATLRVAPDEASCQTSPATVSVIAVGARPYVDPASVTVDVDAGRAVLRGAGLRGAVVRWTAGAASGEDACSDTQDACAVAVGRGLPADATAWTLAVLPAGARATGAVTLHDAQGRVVPAVEYTLHPARVTVAELLPPDCVSTVASGVARVALTHPEAVASVECTDALCDVEAGDLVIRGEHGADNQLDVHLHLEPHVFLARGGGVDANPVLALPLQRCPIAIVGAGPLRGIADQDVVVRVGGRCGGDASLDFYSGGARDGVVRSEPADGQGARFVVVHVERAPGDELSIVAQRGTTVVGTARARTRRPPALHARLELPGLGAIDFIPTNRDAAVLLPVEDGGELVPVPVEGVYTVQHRDGADFIRGVESAAGAVALRMAWRDRTLPPTLRDLDLAELSEPVDRPLHAANIPVPLGARALGDQPLVELDCGDGAGHVQRLVPGTTTYLAYRARDACRLVFHRERLAPEDGTQELNFSVNIVAADGTPREGARIEQRMLLRRADEPLIVYLGGVAAPFDRVVVRLSLAADDQHYAIAPDQKIGASVASVQWALVMGKDRFRLYATTAIPTGLFRVADQGHEGILTLNAGALLRLVMLSPDGHENPIGLEAGAMWLGIAGDTGPAASSRGQVALVAGVGVSVPIANASRATQTSISLHAWLEYEVSRAILDEPGTAVGFVFGPSISVGDVGANF